MTWTHVDQLAYVTSPGLLVNPELVQANVDKMIAIAGSPARLRPHVKTHKMPDAVRLQIDAGIKKFKAATIKEAAMVAEAGGDDVLVSYPMVGPNVKRLFDLTQRFDNTSFATIVDNVDAARSLSEAFTNQPLKVYIDVDCGMHRTGVPLGTKLESLRTQIESLPGVQYAGLHVYDGHLHQPEIEIRRDAAQQIISTIREYDQADPSPAIIGGGSPTFPFWAEQTPWECSPGTPIFWDAGYGQAYPDLQFDKAIALLTRVISKPVCEGRQLICLDLGYKAVAAEMPLENRVTFPDLPDYKFVGHSEEHLVIETSQTQQLSVGQTLLAFPRHVCPTVALHAYATVIHGDSATNQRWPITARDRP